ncbi:MAG: UDP-glucose 4-epimerase [Phycisphaerae bacterium]|nr:UDP-glucose 4-epimerase [Phycisphaerae bacterium]
MKILVTGGAGYVGSHCVRALRAAGHEVVVFDNLEQGNRQAVPPEVELVRGDLLDRRVLANLFRAHQVDGVMHFAALLNVNESVSQPRRYYENNVLGTLNLVGEMMNAEVRKLVFSSSCAIYGTPLRVPIVEDMEKKPISPYGRTKWIVEMALMDLARKGELGSVALRYFNAAGAAADGSIGEARREEYHLIPVVLQVALKQRKKIQIFGTDYPTIDGTAVRDYVHVEDLAQAHLRALEQLNVGEFRAYNVGTGRGFSVRQVIEACQRVSGCRITVEETGRREGDPAELFANPANIQQELGWQPHYRELEPIVETAWNWHRTHPNGFDV